MENIILVEQICDVFNAKKRKGAHGDQEHGHRIEFPVSWRAQQPTDYFWPLPKSVSQVFLSHRLKLVPLTDDFFMKLQSDASAEIS